MAGLGKAARGKRRWIGIRISPATDSRDSSIEIISVQLADINWKMYDCKSDDLETLAIIRVALEDCDETISRLNESKSIETLTKSGKIRLVRERIGLNKTR
tara:strand:- start:439 stop:741 length:303 start_codon:yes stop_codon:yes gene_type:complete